MKLNKFAYLYSKPLGNHTLKIMEKIPGNLLKNLEKSWKYHGILSIRKSGNPAVGCVPPACCPYLPACTAPGGCTCPRGEVPGPGGCTWSGGVPGPG